MWTHFDVMNNLLVQIRGTKRIRLWPPSEVTARPTMLQGMSVHPLLPDTFAALTAIAKCMQEGRLYMAGSSSGVTDIDCTDSARYPAFARAPHCECTLQPGECLYIAALWPHSVLAEDFSVSVNAFYRDPAMPPEQYPRNDLNGDRDPMAAHAAVHAAYVALQELPDQYRQFYGRRCLRALLE